MSLIIEYFTVVVKAFGNSCCKPWVIYKATKQLTSLVFQAHHKVLPTLKTANQSSVCTDSKKRLSCASTAMQGSLLLIETKSALKTYHNCRLFQVQLVTPRSPQHRERLKAITVTGKSPISRAEIHFDQEYEIMDGLELKADRFGGNS
jgi:hypothetical protein